MNIFKKIYQRAKKCPKRIVLPEGAEIRVIKAAAVAAKENLAIPILLGQKDIISRKAKRNSLDISKIEIINPQEDPSLDDYIQSYWQLRQHRGLRIEQARDLVSSNAIYFGAMMLRKGRVDSFIAGACHTTSDIARACLHCIKCDSAHATACGAFIVEVKDSQYGKDGLFLFADCAIVPVPSAQQLADIALTSTELWVKITGFKPRLAMLSFSSKGSSRAECVAKVTQATEMLNKQRPDLAVDGELQLDSAIVPAVAKIKVPQSCLKGKANILIFPNLSAGNIAYKLMQRLAQARVVGPLIQGLKRPCSDLSRGCSCSEIIDALAVASVRAQ